MTRPSRLCNIHSLLPTGSETLWVGDFLPLARGFFNPEIYMNYKGLNHKISLQYSASETSWGSRFFKLGAVMDNFVAFFEDLRERVPSVSSGISSKLKSGFSFGFQKIRSSNFPRRFLSKRIGLGLGVFLAILLVILGGRKIFQSLSSRSTQSDRVEVKGAKAAQDLNREFTFPLKDDKGKEVSKIKFVVERAELRDEIIVKGQRATAVKGRTFLIITLKITNEHNQPIEIDTRDYIRLSVNGNESELLAPDIHNDPVEVQAISTKYTRVGFPINDSDRNLVLLVGEINGEKQKIALELN